MIGIRGIPADLPMGAGGERVAEAEAVRLVERGHRVTVYCRWEYNRTMASYLGVKLISLPSVATKNLGTMSHSLLATLHVLVFSTADIIHFQGMGNGLFVPLAKLGRKHTFVHMDGVDWERPKWGWLAQRMLKLGARIAVRFADEIAVDNQVAQDEFLRIFGKRPDLITLGVEPPISRAPDLVRRYGLEPEQYMLFVGKLVPDKGLEVLIHGYRGLATNVPLVIVGDNPQDPSYVDALRELADTRVLFLGFVYGEAVQALFANCLAYIQPSHMEGRSPALMTAMSYGRCVVVNGIDQNRETIGDAGIAFRAGDSAALANALERVLRDRPGAVHLGQRAALRVRDAYNWEAIIDQLETTYRRIASSEQLLHAK